MKKSIFAAIAIAIIAASSAFAADLNKDDAATIAKDGMGIGMKKAELIVNERNTRGPFKDWTDLKSRVKGFGTKTIEKNATTLTFGPAGAAPAAAPVTTAPAATVPAAQPATVPAR